MRRKEGRKWINLISLYLNYVFQKSTVIIFLVSILFMILALIIIINPNFEYLPMISYSFFFSS